MLTTTNDELFGTSERDALMKALTFGLQPGWGPQKPTLEYGLAQTDPGAIIALHAPDFVGWTSVPGNTTTAALEHLDAFMDVVEGDDAADRTGQVQPAE